MNPQSLICSRLMLVKVVPLLLMFILFNFSNIIIITKAHEFQYSDVESLHHSVREQIPQPQPQLHYHHQMKQQLHHQYPQPKPQLYKHPQPESQLHHHPQPEPQIYHQPETEQQLNHHSQSEPQLHHHIQPESQLHKHLQPEQQSNHHLQSEPQLNHHLQPEPQLNHHLQPEPQLNHHLQPEPQIHRQPQLNYQMAQTYHIENYEEIHYEGQIGPDGEIKELYMGTSLLSIDHEKQMIYQKRQHIYQHEVDDKYYVNFNSKGYCTSLDPSTLIQSDQGPATCNANLKVDIDPATDSSKDVRNLSPVVNKPSHNSNIEEYPLAQPYHTYESSLMGAIRHYWREVLGLCLTSAICLNFLFMFIKRKFNLGSAILKDEYVNNSISKSLSRDITSSVANDSAFDDTASPMSIDEGVLSSSSSDNPSSESLISAHDIPITKSSIRPRSSTLRADPIPIPTNNRKGESKPSSLSNSFTSSGYNSRYSDDFESIQRLGRGGFGIVFEAKNKIDDCHYAVKRICLPLEKEARERVMREVRALAKLDHAGIVRYYNAWLETPPEEWLKQHDAKLGILNSKDGGNCASTDGAYERADSDKDARYSFENKLDYGDEHYESLIPLKRNVNGFKKLKNNSSCQSLDIVFEGSGSIRLESEDNLEEMNSIDDIKSQAVKNGDNISDCDDSEFIQFGPRETKMFPIFENSGDEISSVSHLTEPFSSSSNSSEEDSIDKNDDDVLNRVSNVGQTRKAALIYQKELKKLNNVSLVEAVHTEKAYLYIQMQLCHKETLKDWLRTNCESRDKMEIFDLFYQITDAVEYVHSQDLIHRDLKPSNIFFSLDRTTVKIGDFGLCRPRGIGSSFDLQEYVSESAVERRFEGVHTEQVGTQLYMSPEQLNGLCYNQKVDIFALGLILLELLIPFKTQMQRVNVLFKARNNIYSDEFKIDHPREYELVKSLLSRSPQKRPTATEIKQQELLAGAQLSQPVLERINGQRRRTISSNSSSE